MSRHARIALANMDSQIAARAVTEGFRKLVKVANDAGDGKRASAILLAWATLTEEDQAVIGLHVCSVCASSNDE